VNNRVWTYPRHRDFERNLQKVAADWFASHHYAVHTRYPYILADSNNWMCNIILPEVADYIQTLRTQREIEKRGFPLHKYIHHGLSSQAMIFNLIGPLIVYEDLEPLCSVFAQKGIIWPKTDITACFEFENRNVFHENSGQPTSIDVVLQEKTAVPFIFIEAKLVEKEFGGCSVFADGDCDGRNPSDSFSACYLHHLGRRYWDLLQKHSFLEGPIGQETTCILTAHYQFFREVLFALEYNGQFVLLGDNRNPTFYCDGPQGTRGLFPFLTSLLPTQAQNRVLMISIQEVVQAIKKSGRHGWITDFEKKYGLEQQ
jgi:hypothetical protein